MEKFSASVYGEYGGTSVVLELLGNWILLVTGGPADAGKPGIELAAPPDEPGAETRAFFADPDGHLYEISSLA